MASEPARPLADLALCIGFFTRLPMPALASPPRFADALWAAPLAGAAVGFSVALFYLILLWLGLPSMAAAALALGGGIWLTGALHEDGLADVADGFGGGRDREAKLAIMRDSRIGTYGVVALVLSLLLRWSALVALAGLAWPLLIAVCVAAHATSRALLPAFIAVVPPARADGLGAGVGAVSSNTAIIAAVLGAVALALTGARMFVVCAVLLAALFLGLSRLARGQIGGQTGDVLGSLQQAAETAILIAASSILGTTA